MTSKVSKFDADIIIAYLKGRNANIKYELGFFRSHVVRGNEGK